VVTSGQKTEEDVLKNSAQDQGGGKVISFNSKKKRKKYLRVASAKASRQPIETEFEPF